ncbi:arylesterase [Spongiimicrobium salis]|uniref:arylesterase n=1 Tax=Spongiimicrobium salis TaxID=1667022 RepID=UPI00374DE8E8
MQSFLKFRYFFMFLLALSCKDATEKNENVTTSVEGVQKEASTPTKTKTILFFGDSLTAGYGLDPEEAFPALIQQQLDSLQLKYTVINSGLSGETTASGKNRLEWVLNQKIDVFVLELGANDGLRGIPLSETRLNLQLIIDAVKEENPEVQIVLAGMQIPPNMGQEYTLEFSTIFPQLAEANNIHLIPFLLKDVGGIPQLNQSDGIHPTIEGHKIVATNMWKTLGPIVME